MTLPQFAIRYEPLADPRYPMPEEIAAEYAELHDRVHDQPAEAARRLEGLVARYPQVVQLTHALAAAYGRCGRSADSAALIEQNYRRHPDYLLARCQYAHWLLEQGQWQRAAEVFEGKFDLPALCPQRREFHITEVTGFYGAVGMYHLLNAEVGKAEESLKLLQQAAPHHGATQHLEQMYRKLKTKMQLLRMMGKKR